jgi:hypothetical protein
MKSLSNTILPSWQELQAKQFIFNLPRRLKQQKKSGLLEKIKSGLSHGTPLPLGRSRGFAEN